MSIGFYMCSPVSVISQINNKYKATRKLKREITKHYKIFEQVHVKRVLITYVNSEGSGEVVYPRSLARAFVVCTQNIWSKRKLKKDDDLSLLNGCAWALEGSLAGRR